jgi:hypothetical protein
MKLYDLKRGDKFKVIYEGEEIDEVLTFDRLDGCYSICFDTSNQINHIAAYAEVILVKELPS